MSSTTRKNRSFSLDPDLIVEVERSKGPHSASERVNHLLRRALEMERKAKLASEAAEFFADTNDDERASRRALQKATIRSLTRE